MLVGFGMADFSPADRIIATPYAPAVPLFTVRARSYLAGGTVEFGHPHCHVLIGKYTSCALGLKILIGLNHDYRCISTYPFTAIPLSKDNPILPEAPPLSDSAYPALIDRSQIIIGNDVWIGSGVTIMSGVYIGSGAVIGADTVVRKDVPPYAVVVGNPARIVRYRFDEETIARFMRIKWWNWETEKIEQHIPQAAEDVAGFLEKFDTGREEENEEASTAEIRRLRDEGYRIFHFITDFTAPTELAAWPYVVDAYLAAYKAGDRTALVLDDAADADYERCVQDIVRRIAARGADAPLILMCERRDGALFSVSALQSADVYITTRDSVCSSAADYAYEAGVLIRYGLDHPSFVFPPL